MAVILHGPSISAAELAASSVGTSEVIDGTLVNADIDAAAAIALSKLADLTDGSVIVGSAANVPTAVDADTGSASKIIARTGSFTATISNASPGVVTKTSHGLLDGDLVVLSTTGALPAGLSVATAYYVVNKTANTFELSATYAGTSINTTDAGSGTHTVSYAGLAYRPLSISNLDVAASAAIALSKLAALTSARLIVGSAGNVPAAVDVTGDVTISNAGVTAIGASKVLPSMVEADLARYADVQLTNAQVLALRATPITLVSAPGANRATLVHAIYAMCDSAAAAYTETADNIAIEYGDGTDILVLETTGWIDAGAVSPVVMRPAVAQSTALVANSVVRAFNNGDGEFGGGNVANTLSFRVYYSVVDTVAFS